MNPADSDELARVRRVLQDEDYIPPIPDVVLSFRKAIREFKRHTYNSLETDGRGNQKPQHLEQAVERVVQFGNGLKYILEGLEESAVIRDIFATLRSYMNERGVPLDDLNEEDRDLCLHYIYTDIYVHPYDLSLSHINSAQKSR